MWVNGKREAYGSTHTLHIGLFKHDKILVEIFSGFAWDHQRITMQLSSDQNLNMNNKKQKQPIQNTKTANETK